MFKQFATVLLLFFAGVSTYAKTFTEYSISAAGRSYVRGASVEAAAKYDILLWGDKKNELDWQYGFFQFFSSVATHGQFQMGASVFPVSFLELGFKKSWTQRYSESSVFSCQNAQCYGLAFRTDYRVRLALGYEQLAFLYSHNTSLLETENTDEPIIDELENLQINSSGDIGNADAVFVGYNLPGSDKKTIGLAHRRFEYLHTQVENELLTLVYRSSNSSEKKYDQTWFATVGVYRSTFSESGFFVGGGISRSWGQGLSLF